YHSQVFNNVSGNFGFSDAQTVLPSAFFFSSRRRHTSSKRDWSSDVCSSDLAKSRPGWERLTRPPESAKRTSPAQDRLWAPSLTCLPSKCEASLSTPAPTCFRSELCCTKWPLARCRSVETPLA